MELQFACFASAVAAFVSYYVVQLWLDRRAGLERERKLFNYLLQEINTRDYKLKQFMEIYIKNQAEILLKVEELTKNAKNK